MEHENKQQKPTRGRPPGQTKAAGYASGRPIGLDTTQQARYEHWRNWWQSRPGSEPSAYSLAKSMEQSTRLVQLYATGTRTPGPVALANLESLCATYGYEPLTADHQFL